MAGRNDYQLRIYCTWRSFMKVKLDKRVNKIILLTTFICWVNRVVLLVPF